MEFAKPKAQPPSPQKSRRENAAAIRAAATVRVTKEQEAFAADAAKIAASLGWEGEDNWVLNGIQNSDARRFIAKTLHEVHVAALNPGQPKPSSADVCAHLGLPADSKEIAEAIEVVWKTERGNPTSAFG
jgi:hypothetical protein